MTKREAILDDPETLKMVKDEFAKYFPHSARRILDNDAPSWSMAWTIWRSFRLGFEAGYWADEIPLHSG